MKCCLLYPITLSVLLLSVTISSGADDRELFKKSLTVADVERITRLTGIRIEEKQQLASWGPSFDRQTGVLSGSGSTMAGKPYNKTFYAKDGGILLQVELQGGDGTRADRGIERASKLHAQGYESLFVGNKGYITKAGGFLMFRKGRYGVFIDTSPFQGRDGVDKQKLIEVAKLIASRL